MIGYVTSPSTSNFFSGFSTGPSAIGPSMNSQYISKPFLFDELGWDSSFSKSISAPFTDSSYERDGTDDYDLLSKKLMSFAFLCNDWDGYDGIPASRDIVDYSLTLLSEIHSDFLLPGVTLSGSGNISFYWKNTYDKTYIEIELDEVGKYSYLVKYPDLAYGEDDVDYFLSGICEGLVKGLSSFRKYPTLMNVA